MFTGLIDHTATICHLTKLDAGVRLQIDSQFSDLTEGESIAVDGICLTAINIQKNKFELELSQETLSTTTAKFYQPNQLVNVERALKMNDRLGGHFVTGHVDQTATVNTCEKYDKFTQLKVHGIKPYNLIYLIDKGSICLNGVSLTLNKIYNDGFEIMLIPHTLVRTTLSQLKKNSAVNIEFDLLTKIIAKQTRGTLHEQSI